MGPRDGLQNIGGKIVPTEVKLELIQRLLKSGVKVMEVGSFVRPDRVPQVSEILSELAWEDADTVPVHSDGRYR